MNTEINIDIQNMNYVNTEINIDIHFNFSSQPCYIIYRWYDGGFKQSYSLHIYCRLQNN